MAKKLEMALDKMHARLDALESNGVNITKLATGKRNFVAEGLAANRKKFEANKAKSAAEAAANWIVGQPVRTRIGVVGTIIQINEGILILDCKGVIRKFAASTVTAA